MNNFSEAASISRPAAKAERGPAPILLVANNFPPMLGGSSVVYTNMARCCGRRMIVVAPSINYEDRLPFIGWREHDRAAAYRVVRLPLLRTPMDAEPPLGLRKSAFLLYDLAIRSRLTLALLRLVVQEGVWTICVGELLASGWLIRVLRYVPGLRIVAYIHGEEITTQDSYDLHGRRSRRALGLCDRIIVVSRFTEAVVRSLLGPAAQDRISLIENGVDLHRFRPDTKPGYLQDQYRLRECFVFVSVCRLVERKGIDQAIRAFAQAAHRHPDIRYLIVGTGHYQEQLTAIAAKAGVAEKVIFAGQVTDDELVDYYQLGDVFVMPNRRLENGDTEGFGLVFLEANGCGLPVIAGRDGGSTDAVKDGVNGLVVDGNSVPEIAAAMLKLREDDALRQNLARQALEVASRASWTEKARKFLAVCAEA